MDTIIRSALLTVLLLLLLLLCACDEAPDAGMNAREYLVAHGVSDRVIEGLLMQAELPADDIAGLLEFDRNDVLGMVAANPGTPESALAELARHGDMQVRAGVAANPHSSQDLLLQLWIPGRYTAVNDALARNPNLPAKMLREMYENREAMVSGIAMNPNTPPDVMHAIARDGEELDRIWLAGNPNLPDDLVQTLAQDHSPVVRERLKNRGLQDADDVVVAHERDRRD